MTFIKNFKLSLPLLIPFTLTFGACRALDKAIKSKYLFIKKNEN
jgi:hypothetical protein